MEIELIIFGENSAEFEKIDQLFIESYERRFKYVVFQNYFLEDELRIVVVSECNSS